MADLLLQKKSSSSIMTKVFFCFVFFILGAFLNVENSFIRGLSDHSHNLLGLKGVLFLSDISSSNGTSVNAITIPVRQRLNCSAPREEWFVAHPEMQPTQLNESTIGFMIKTVFRMSIGIMGGPTTSKTSLKFNLMSMLRDEYACGNNGDTTLWSDFNANYFNYYHTLQFNLGYHTMNLSILETPGVGQESTGLKDTIELLSIIADQMEEYKNRGFSKIDNRIDTVLYVFGTRMNKVDIDCLKIISQFVKIIPVVGKADSITPEGKIEAKAHIIKTCAENGIVLSDFSDEVKSNVRAKLRLSKDYPLSSPYFTVTSNDYYAEAIVGNKTQYAPKRCYADGRCISVMDISVSDFPVLETAIFFSSFVQERSEQKDVETATMTEALASIRALITDFKGEHDVSDGRIREQFNNAVVSFQQIFGRASGFVSSVVFGHGNNKLNNTTTSDVLSTVLNPSLNVDNSIVIDSDL